MKNKCLYFALAAMLTACGTNQSNTDKVTYLSKDDLPPLQQLELEQIPLPEEFVMGAYNYSVYHDSVLIISYSQPHPFFLTIVNLNTKEIIKNLFTKGNGPGELQNMDCWLRDNRLNVYDSGRKQFAVLNMDSLLVLRQTFSPKMLQLTGQDYLPVFDILTDTSFVFFNNWYLEGCGNPANENIPELLFAGLDGAINFEPQDGADIVSNCNTTLLVTNPAQNKLFIAYEYKPQFTLLTTNLDTIKIIRSPEPIEKQKYSWFSETTNTVIGPISYRIFGPERYYQYSIYAVSTENYIFLEMSHNRGVSREERMEAARNDCPEIFQLDWNGNPIARYQQGKKVMLIAGYSEATKTLYISANNEDGEKALFKAKL